MAHSVKFRQLLRPRCSFLDFRKSLKISLEYALYTILTPLNIDIVEHTYYNIPNILGQILLIFGFTLLSPIISFAQETSEIKSSTIIGKVVDENKNGIPGATISLINKLKNREITAFSTCDDFGKFKLSAEPGDYYSLIISSLNPNTRIICYLNILKKPQYYKHHD